MVFKPRMGEAIGIKSSVRTELSEEVDGYERERTDNGTVWGLRSLYREARRPSPRDAGELGRDTRQREAERRTKNTVLTRAGLKLKETVDNGSSVCKLDLEEAESLAGYFVPFRKTGKAHDSPAYRQANFNKLGPSEVMHEIVFLSGRSRSGALLDADPPRSLYQICQIQTGSPNKYS